MSNSIRVYYNHIYTELMVLAFHDREYESTN